MIGISLFHRKKGALVGARNHYHLHDMVFVAVLFVGFYFFCFVGFISLISFCRFGFFFVVVFLFGFFVLVLFLLGMTNIYAGLPGTPKYGTRPT